MLVIRRLVDRHRAYTALMLPGEPANVFPTSDQEHARILKIFKQDRPYPDVINDFNDWPASVETTASDTPKDPTK